MTNVRKLRPTIRHRSPSSRVPGEIAAESFQGVPLRSVPLAGLLSAVVAMLFAASSAPAEEFTFGRTPAGSVPSGAASGVVDINRQGLGFSARAGHVAGKTVGRDESVSLFQLSPYVNIGDGLLFGDSRLTYANNGGLAWSFGGGYRQYVTAWDVVLGGNIYADRDSITGAHFKQWGVGGEVLANRWEARGNVYQTYGKSSQQTGARIDPNSAIFVGNEIQFNRIDTFAEALHGFDAEIGWLLPGDVAERFDIRAFGGGYYYKGEGVPHFSGFSTRMQADIADWLELGLKLTDDEVFHTNVNFSAIVHFGGFRSQDHTKRSAMQRMAEPVRRNVNIAAITTDVVIGGQVATAPDGTPLDIIHVNSNAPAGGDGTVENPFNSLAIGLGVPDSDVVFTHAGSLFNAAPDNLVVLNPSQNLFGEGLIIDPSGNRNVVNTVALPGLGELTLPSSPTFLANPALERPMLVNSAGPAVTLGDSSRFGGFIIDASAGHGIFADTVSDVLVRDTLISNALGDGIFLNNVLSSATIIDSAIQNAAGAAFHVNGGDAQIGFTSTSIGLDPSYGFITNSSNEVVLIENTTGGSVNMTGTTLDDDGGTGIVIRDSAGNAVIDNASILNSTATGIAITNSSGVYSFRDTIRPATRIENATDASVLIDSLAETGRVSFENLNIVTPAGGGIDINNLAGQFNFTQDLTIGVAAAGSTAPFISVDGSAATGAVRFTGDITILAGAAPASTGGRGIELINSVTGSTFAALGQTSISAVGAEGIAIENDASAITFGSANLGGVTIQETALQGILVNNTTGTVLFQNTANVIQNTNAGNPLVDIQSADLVQFDGLQVLATTPDIGVNLLTNGQIIIDTLGIVTNGGTSLFGTDNELIRTATGTITATDAAAVDIQNSGINITLEQVNSTNSPTYGIRLQETNKDLSNHPIVARTFTVLGDAILNPTALSGGTISTANNEGVLLENAGQIRLQAMNLFDNEYGVRLVNSGITVDDQQFLLLFGDNILESDVRGLDATNLTRLDIRDSLFADNGDLAPVGRESILLRYSETPNDPDTNVYLDYDNPYLVNIERTQFIDNTDDVITIFNTPGGIDAHLGVVISGNQFILNDTNDFDAADTDESAIEIDWNGPTRIDINSNEFSLAGTNAGQSQTAMYIRNRNLLDLTELEIVGNVIDNSTQPTAFGVDMITAGASTSLITGNAFNFSGVSSTGMHFILGSDTRMDWVGNLIRFEAEGGTGILVERTQQRATYQISGNIIQLSDALVGIGFPNDPPLERGIVFQSISGTINLFGPQNNIIEMITPGDIDVFFSPAAPTPTINGQILVNGNLGP